MALQYDFRDKIALVTGGTRGIGRRLVGRFARAGADVAFIYKNNVALADELGQEVTALGRRCLPLKADLESVDEIRVAFEELATFYGGLDILVANAAASSFRPFLDLKPHNVDRTMSMVVRGYILLVQEAAKLMGPRGGGKIVGVSGSDSITYVQNHGLLGAAKAGLEVMTRYAAVELAGQRIIANAVIPGPVDTDSARIYAASTGIDWDTFSASWVSNSPYRRLATPDEIANVILFLCSPESDWIVGQCIPVDGGWTLMEHRQRA